LMKKKANTITNFIFRRSRNRFWCFTFVLSLTGKTQARHKLNPY